MSKHETNEDLFNATFWERAWGDFFDDYSQPEYWEDVGAAAQVEPGEDGEDNIIAVDARPHIQHLLLKKALIQKDREKGTSLKFSTLKSHVVEEVLKRENLYELHQSAIENVRWAHQQKEEAVEIPVPPLLLAALIQYWQMVEAGKSKLAKEMDEIKDWFDDHDSPLGGRRGREGLMMKPIRSSEGGSVVAGGKAARFEPEMFVRTETGRIRSDRPNESAKPGFERGNFTHLSSETGRSSSNKPNCEQVDEDGVPVKKIECCDKVVLIEIPKEEDDE